MSRPGSRRLALGLLALTVVGAGWLAADGERVWGQEERPDRPQSELSVVLASSYGGVVRVEVRPGDGPPRPAQDRARWGLLRSQAPRSEGGAGLVVGERLVLTHQALLRFADSQITVVTISGRRVSARVLAEEPDWGLAVLETEADLRTPSEGSPLALGESPTRPGSLVLALGYPFRDAKDDSRPRASLGIVEGRVRIDSGALAQAGPVLLTDAPINPGAEGGPLLDLDGRVIGVLAPLTRDRRSDDLVGYAVPIEIGRRLVGEARHGRARIGLLVREVAGQGLVVVSVRPGAAAQAGLEPGDRLRRAGSTRLDSRESLRLALAETAPGDTLRLVLERGGVEVSCELRRPVAADEGSSGKADGDGARDGGGR